jgi:hypothetical protein
MSAMTAAIEALEKEIVFERRKLAEIDQQMEKARALREVDSFAAQKVMLPLKHQRDAHEQRLALLSYEYRCQSPPGAENRGSIFWGREN